MRWLTRKIFETVNGHVAAKGFHDARSTIVDATLIAASPSTKDKKRDPENAPAGEAKRLAFWSESRYRGGRGIGLVHTMIATAGNVSDVTQAHALLDGDEVAAIGDAATKA